MSAETVLALRTIGAHVLTSKKEAEMFSSKYRGQLSPFATAVALWAKFAGVYVGTEDMRGIPNFPLQHGGLLPSRLKLDIDLYTLPVMIVVTRLEVGPLKHDKYLCHLKTVWHIGDATRLSALVREIVSSGTHLLPQPLFTEAALGVLMDIRSQEE